MRYRYYHENNFSLPYLPAEDAGADLLTADSAVFAVADGITHDPNPLTGNYPHPSPAAQIAQIAVETITATVSENSEALVSGFLRAQANARNFNQYHPQYIDRENNSYDFGACVVAAAQLNLEKNILNYAILDDCYVQVYRKVTGDGKEHWKPQLEFTDYVATAADYLFNQNEENYHWDAHGKKIWRKLLRNSELYGYGYGAITGFGDFLPYLQTGEFTLKSNDIVAIYSDGFIPALKSAEFIEILAENIAKKDFYTAISAFLRENEISKEKTAYFIQI